MDSLSQIVLGAAVAGALVPSRRALVYGAALATLPDLDVLLRFADPVDRLTLHRTASHSLIVLSIAAPLLWTLAQHFDAALKTNRWRWLWLFWLSLITHPLLDVMTIYGTQLLWPIDRTPLGFGSVFVIDPFYTLPLLLACIWAWREKAAPRVCQIALAFSSSYLAFGVYMQQRVSQWVIHDLQKIGVVIAPESSKLLITTAPLTSLMHRVILREPGRYREAYVSSFFDQHPIQWQTHASADQWLPSLRKQTSFQRLENFSHGFFGLDIERINEQAHVVYSDLRMGEAGTYVFRYDLGHVDHLYEQVIKLPSQRPSSHRAAWLWYRLTDEFARP
jgi:inner membrane protein